MKNSSNLTERISFFVSLIFLVTFASLLSSAPIETFNMAEVIYIAIFLYKINPVWWKDEGGFSLILTAGIVAGIGAMPFRISEAISAAL